MGLKNEKPDRHRRIGLLQQGMAAGEHLCQPDLVAIALAHLSPVEGDHIIMQPVAGGYMLVRNGALRDFALVMGKLEVHSAAMDVELFAEIFGAHSGAFYMPARKPFSPGALPAHDVFRGRSLPEGKVLPVMLFILPIEV